MPSTERNPNETGSCQPTSNLASTFSIANFSVKFHLTVASRNKKWQLGSLNSRLNRVFLTHIRSPPPVKACHRAAVVAMDKNQSYWATIEADIEAYLKKAITIRPPVTVFEPMHHLTFAAPRTKAPALVHCGVRAYGGRP
ncbi:Geranyl diphosphate synthase small subunit [Forsythia ovata]|uniref:Geranyl diphosphate synthase small subunit n=1 Tax=Forsythia ovata TaxID=205694 RepID=A0ABD1S6N6_9LAMI